jgi:selenocysteine lyase/cysteine desulfurase
MIDVEAVRREIPCLERCIYTNTAGFGPLPRPVWADLRRREEAIYHQGLDVLAHDPEWCEEPERWRARLARHFGAEVDELGLSRALGEGLNMVIAGLEWRPGDEIVITDQEHPTGLLPALNLAATHGVRVRPLVAAATGDDEILERCAALLGPRTRLLAISAVTTETGVRLPVERIATLASEWEVPVYLDLAQAAGQIPLDLHRLRCDFAAGSGSKWLLGPLGTAFFFIRRDWIERLRVAWTGSNTATIGPDRARFELAPGARRFEFGGRHWPLLGAMTTAADWVGGFGWSHVEQRAAVLATSLKNALGRIPGAQVLTPLSPERSTGIVSFSLAGRHGEAVVEALRARWRIRCRPTLFNGVRISLAFFNTEEEVDAIAGAVRELCN